MKRRNLSVVFVLMVLVGIGAVTDQAGMHEPGRAEQGLQILAVVVAAGIEVIGPGRGRH